MNKLKIDKKVVFYALYFSICLICAFSFSPVIYADSSRYILFAQEIIGIATETDLRGILSPLYSVLLTPFILLFGDGNFAFPVICFQYLLIFFAAILIQKISIKLKLSMTQSYLLGLIAVLLPSTVQFGYFILSEVVTYFFFITTLYCILRFSEERYLYLLVVAGIASTLMIFARFNMIFVPLVFSIYLILISIKRENLLGNTVGVMKNLVIYLLPVLLALNVWSYRNLQVHGFYFPFARMNSLVHISGSLMLLEEDTPVREEDKIVKKIFLDAKKALQEDQINISEGSLLSTINLTFYQKLNNGSRILGNCLDTLYRYYGIEDKKFQRYSILFEKLMPLHESILESNSGDLFLLRVFSMASTFRLALSPSPEQFHNTINVLPPILIQAMKFLYILVYPAIIIGLILVFMKKKGLKVSSIPQLLHYVLLASLVIYFPVLMFLTADPENSSRFKYPSEILVITVLFMVYNTLKSVSSLRNEANFLETDR